MLCNELVTAQHPTIPSKIKIPSKQKSKIQQKVINSNDYDASDESTDSESSFDILPCKTSFLHQSQPTSLLSVHESFSEREEGEGIINSESNNSEILNVVNPESQLNSSYNSETSNVVNPESQLDSNPEILNVVNPDSESSDQEESIVNRRSKRTRQPITRLTYDEKGKPGYKVA